MVDKTITITEEAYRSLKARRAGEESFSDVILRLTKRRPLRDFVGRLGPDSADAIRRAIDEDRAMRGRVDARLPRTPRARASMAEQRSHSPRKRPTDRPPPL